MPNSLYAYHKYHKKIKDFYRIVFAWAFMYNINVKIRKYIIPLILAFLGFLIYSNVLYALFIFDDEQYIVNNHQIHNISNFLKDFSGTRYIAFLSFAINYYFGGLNTFGYHLVNTVIHILNSILVYVLVQITADRLKAKGEGQEEKPFALSLLPFACSIIFLVHPIQTQAVTYITQRFASLATLFYLLALVLYVKARLKIQGSRLNLATCNLYLASILSAVLAMKTKEISFTLPFIIILYEFTFLNPSKLPFDKGDFLKRFLYPIPYLLTLSIIPLTLFSASNGVLDEIQRQSKIYDLTALPKYEYLLTQFNVIVTYIRLLFLPINQNLDYDYSMSHSIFEPKTFLSFAFLLTIFSFAVYLYIRSHKTHHAHGLLISFGIFWFFITLSVESSIIPIKDVIFEHRVYLPSVGFILSITTAVFYGFDYLEKLSKKSLIHYLLFIILFSAAILSFSTYKRNILWSDDILMWLDVVKKSPNNARGHNNLGKVYQDKGLIDEAIKEYLTALKLKPDYAIAYNNLGLAYYDHGWLDEAIKEYLTALELNPNYEDALNNLGNAYASKGMFDKAMEKYITVLELNADYIDAHNNLGNIYANQGRFTEAIKEYLIVLRLNTKYIDVHNNLGNVYYNQGRLDEAIEEYLTTLRLEPTFVKAYYNLGLAYWKKGLKNEARKEFEKALKLKPDFTPAKKAIETLE